LLAGIYALIPFKRPHRKDLLAGVLVAAVLIELGKEIFALAPRQHLVRYYGAYSNRARREFRPNNDKMEVGGARGPKLDADALADPESEFASERRQSWARLLRKVLEVDPLLCPQCQVEMKIVSVITDPVVVDSILRHVEEGGGHDPHAPRAPPAA